MNLAAAAQALSISRELTDTRAERAVLRLLARGYRAVLTSCSQPCSMCDCLMSEDEEDGRCSLESLSHLLSC